MTTFVSIRSLNPFIVQQRNTTTGNYVILLKEARPFKRQPSPSRSS